MSKAIDIERIISTATWCDFLSKDKLSDDLPRCGGYLEECSECEIPKYYTKAKVGLTKLKLGI